MKEPNVILEISKSNIIHNYNFFNKLSENNICAVTVKSNAYGLGANEIYSLLYKNGCKHFFVATTEEGITLRKKYKKGIIYILNGTEFNDLKIFKKYNLIPILSNLHDYRNINIKSLKYGIQINTGINRLGLNYEESKKRLTRLQKILEEFQKKNNESYLYKNCKVLIENKLNNQEKYFGRTENMTPVILEADECKIGEIIDVEVNSFNKKNLFGFRKLNKERAA